MSSRAAGYRALAGEAPKLLAVIDWELTARGAPPSA